MLPVKVAGLKVDDVVAKWEKKGKLGCKEMVPLSVAVIDWDGSEENVNVLTGNRVGETVGLAVGVTMGNE